MAAVLALIFGPPVRLLPLAIALAAVAILFGCLAAIGGSLTMASLAVLPILIGLAVDYAIQFQARFAEARALGSSPPRAAVEAAARGGPVIATAAVATAAGFTVLLLSPIPMVRGFGLLLLVGIVVAFFLALTVGLAGLSLTAGARRSALGARRSRGVRRSPLAESRTWAAVRIGRLGRRALAVAVAAPGRILVGALVLAAIGWAAGTRTEVVSDIRDLVPRDLAELRSVDELQAATGVSGEIDVTVSAPDVSDPELVAWMRSYKRRVLDRAGFGSDSEACVDQRTELCPSIALPDLFGDRELTRARVRRVLSLLPPYFSQAVVSVDPGSGAIGDTAVISFGIKVMPFDEQKRLIDSIRAEIDPPGTAQDPPAGVSADVVGLPVLVADANSALEQDRYLLTLAGLVAVALALLAIYRSLRRAPRAPDPDRPRDRMVGARPRDHRGAAEPDVSDPGGAGDRDRDRVQRPDRGSLRGGAARRGDGRRGAAAHLRPHRDGGRRFRIDRGRRLRGADRDRHPDAAGLRHRHGARPLDRARRRAARPPGRARLGGERLRPVRCP